MSLEVRPPPRRTRTLYWLVDYVAGPVVLWLLGGLHVTGRQNIPARGGALICPNHTSYLDPPVTGIAAKRRCCFMARESLFKVPLLGPLIRRWNSYPVDREEGGRQAIRVLNMMGKG